MRVLITGGSGLIGGALAASLRSDGHEVVTVVRRQPQRPDEFRWDPAAGIIDTATLDGVDAAVNLAGASIAGRRWTRGWKQQIRCSRVDATATLVRALTDHGGVGVLVSGSAVGFYGDRGEAELDESAEPGSGFLADVVVDWERQAAPAADAGIRVALIRTGIVLAPDGGALGTVLPIFRLGAGGPLGRGRQWMSWISITDEVAAIRRIIGDRDLAGPINLTAPLPVRNADYTKAIGRALHRPTVVPVPPLALRAALGGLADEGLLASQRVLPGRLLDVGFEFTHDDVDAALRALL